MVFSAEVQLKRFDCSHFKQSWRLLCLDCSYSEEPIQTIIQKKKPERSLKMCGICKAIHFFPEQPF